MLALWSPDDTLAPRQGSATTLELGAWDTHRPDAGGLLTLSGPHLGGNRFEPNTLEQITRFLGALERQEQGAQTSGDGGKSTHELSN